MAKEIKFNIRLNVDGKERLKTIPLALARIMRGYATRNRERNVSDSSHPGKAEVVKQHAQRQCRYAKCHGNAGVPLSQSLTPFFFCGGNGLFFGLNDLNVNANLYFLCLIILVHIT